MGYNTSTTQWPTAVPSDAAKDLIDRFFSLLDDPSSTVGSVLAKEIFATDGKLVAPAGTASGAAEILNCREHAWKVVKERRHEIRRVYTHDTDGSDLMLIGGVHMGLANGKSVSGEFAARIVFSKTTSADLRIMHYEVWADSAPLSKALVETSP